MLCQLCQCLRYPSPPLSRMQNACGSYASPIRRGNGDMGSRNISERGAACDIERFAKVCRDLPGIADLADQLLQNNRLSYISDCRYI